MRLAFVILGLLCLSIDSWAVDTVSSQGRVNAAQIVAGGAATNARSRVLACSPAWEKKLAHCEGAECGELIDQADSALDAEIKKFLSDLADPASFNAAEANWSNYRDANCDALNPTCPDGVSGSCSEPVAICRAELNCAQVKYLVQGECTLLNGYNSREGFVVPDRCKVSLGK